jgi:hypothetical protein
MLKPLQAATYIATQSTIQEGKVSLVPKHHTVKAKWVEGRNYLSAKQVRGVQRGVKRSSMRDIIAPPPQISTSPSSGRPCCNKRGTDDRKMGGITLTSRMEKMPFVIRLAC